ncbi:MAG: response regulator transcription factor [Verrucomicrobiota bacterium]
MKVLIAEDDKHTADGLAMIFEEEGYDAFTVPNGDAALSAWQQRRPDVICLDIMMPDRSGYEVCKEIRRTDTTVPIVFISAKSEEVDKVLGLELGADDFIVKPFGVKEVIARIRAITRRSLARGPESETRAPFMMDDLNVVPAELRVYRNGSSTEISLRDLKILQCLYRNTDKVVDRDQLFNEAWGFDHMPNSRSLDQHVSQLRKRVEKDPKNPTIIRTVHGAGYRYEAS